MSKHRPFNSPQKQTEVQIQQSSFRGPLPPPEVLQKYEIIQAGFADRIVKMAEDEAKHRREREVAGQNAEIEAVQTFQNETQRGQFFGFAIGVIAIISGTVASIMGAPWPGGFIGSAGVIGLVTVFIIGRKLPKE